MYTKPTSLVSQLYSLITKLIGISILLFALVSRKGQSPDFRRKTAINPKATTFSVPQNEQFDYTY